MFNSPAETKPTRFHLNEWVSERTSKGEVVKVTTNKAGKEIVTYRMTSGQTATQFAEFLEPAQAPVEAVEAN